MLLNDVLYDGRPWCWISASRESHTASRECLRLCESPCVRREFERQAHVVLRADIEAVVKGSGRVQIRALFELQVSL